MVTGNLNEQVRVTEFKTKRKDAGVTANPRPWVRTGSVIAAAVKDDNGKACM